MSRLAILPALLLPAAATAIPPEFNRGGLLISFQYGWGKWFLDRDHLARQVDAGDPGGADIFVGQARASMGVASLHLGYNILGHATVGADFTATGWDVFDKSRGGAGFLVGSVRWSPLELIFKGRKRPVDAAVFFGMGYGIAGQERGMDGLILETGANAEYYFTPAFYAGLVLRWVFLHWRTWHIDFDNKVTLPLPEGSGGSFFTMGLALGFRFQT